MKVQTRKRQRKYNAIWPYFHNYEHDSQGHTHCDSDGEYPYTITHQDGRHIISSRLAKGHGRSGKPQMFKFTERLGDGYDMSCGVPVDMPTAGRHSISKSRVRITPSRPKLPKR